MVSNIFATRLHDLMKAAKVTQKDVATAVGTTRQAISQYVNGDNQPNAERLYEIAKIFNVSADYLIGLSDIPHRRVIEHEQEILTCRAIIQELHGLSTQFLEESEKIIGRQS